MPAIPDQDLADAAMPLPLASSPIRELFPMPDIPDEDPPTVAVVTSSASTRGPELFSMPAIPDEDRPSAPAPLTEAEVEMQALIQSAMGSNPTLSGGNISVALSAEGIELSGTVASIQAKVAATRLAKSYAAGRKVVDKITVAANPPEPHPEATPVKADSPGTTHQQHP
jgi:hypothetical protein